MSACVMWSRVAAIAVSTRRTFSNSSDEGATMVARLLISF